MLFVHSLNPSILEHARDLCGSNGLFEHRVSNQSALFASGLATSRTLENGHVVVAKGEHFATQQLKAAQAIEFDELGSLLVDGQEMMAAHAIIYIDHEAVRAACDALATFPLFYFRNSDMLVISDRLSLICQLVEAGLDPAGFMEFMRFGFFIGDRSPLQNVHRIRAGETIRLSTRESAEFSSARRQFSWVPEAGDPDGTATSLEEITDLLLEASAVPDGTMLMMSAGWDSRTILAALLARGTKDILLYNHGGSDSREAMIVKKICRDFGLNLTQAPLSEEAFRPENLREYFSRYENVIFPHWHAAGYRARSEGRPCVASGVLGEVLGGHYGSPMLMSGMKKMSAVALYLSVPALAERAFCSGNNGWGLAIERLRQGTYQKPWYLAEKEWSKKFSDVASEVNADIERELGFYRGSGIEAPEALVECYITNHRAAQYICAQILSCTNDNVAVSMPFAHAQLMRISSRIPFKNKVHNRLNQKIIGRLAPELLNYPMAATLVPARRPVLLQEASRLARRVGETLQWKAHGMAPTHFQAPNLGWANFQFMGTKFFDELVESLELDLFDKAGMQQFIGAREHEARHPIWDMLAKMKTLDRMTATPG